jgi:hypothetical protein
VTKTISSKSLWIDNKTPEDIEYFSKEDSDNVVYNLQEDILCLKDMIAELEKTLKDTAIIWGGKLQELEKERDELIKEFAEAECMGDLAKITRQYGYEALKEQE